MTDDTDAPQGGARRRAKERSANAILSAAARVLSRHGYAGTTISRVAEAAGVSRGLVHYHFTNKEEMLAKVLQVNMQQSIETADTVLSGCTSAEDFADGLISAIKSLLENNPDYLNLFLEGLVTARYSDAVRRELGGLYRSFRTSLRNNLAGMERAGVISPAIPPDGLAALIAGLLDGIGIQRATVTDPARDEELWEYVRRGLLALLTARKKDQES